MLSKKKSYKLQRSDLANKTKTTTNVNQPNPTNTLPIRIQTYINKMPISSTILWQDKISMSREWQQFTNTRQIHQSDANMTDTIPYPCHLSTTGTEKTVNHRPIRQSTANPYPIPIPANASVKCKNTLNTLATCIGRYWGRIGCGLSDKYKSANFFNTNLNLFQNAMNSINLCQWLCCLREALMEKKR